MRTDRGWTATGARRLLVLTGCSALYLVPACVIAARRPLWHDEIYTFYLARLPSMADVWSALAAGTDLAPPFFYAVTRAALALCGESPLALRLPAVLGTWAMALCVFALVAARAGTVAGALGLLFALSTHAAHYSYEARPTGLVGGFAGLALVAWRCSAAERWRPLAVAALAIGLAGAIATHYYAALILAPLVVAEAARARARGRLDLPVLAALAAALVPLAIQAPLLAGARPYVAGFWSRPRWGSMVEFYEIAFGSAAAPLIALLAAGVAAAALRRREDGAGVAPSLHEAVAVAGVAVMPVAAVALARLTGGVFSPRYVLWSVIGAAVLFGWTAGRALGGDRRLGAAVALVLVVTLARADAQTLRDARTHRDDQAAVVAFLGEHAAVGRPIVVGQSGEYLELVHASPAELAARLVYLADADASRRHIGHDTAELGLLELRRRAPIRVVEYGTFAAAHRSFQVFARDGRRGWLMEALPAADVRLRARRGTLMIFDVELRGGPPSSAGREFPGRSS